MTSVDCFPNIREIVMDFLQKFRIFFFCDKFRSQYQVFRTYTYSEYGQKTCILGGVRWHVDNETMGKQSMAHLEAVLNHQTTITELV